MTGSTVILEADFLKFSTLLEQLTQTANAKFVFLADRAGQQIASAGDMTGVDPTSLASLTAGNVAATEGVAQLIGEADFNTLYHEGVHDSLHMTGIGNRAILLVVFDERSSLGLVRLRVDQTAPQLAEVVDEVHARTEEETALATANSPAATAFAEITDDDIDALFG